MSFAQFKNQTQLCRSVIDPKNQRKKKSSSKNRLKNKPKVIISFEQNFDEIKMMLKI